MFQLSKQGLVNWLYIQRHGKMILVEKLSVSNLISFADPNINQILSKAFWQLFVETETRVNLQLKVDFKGQITLAAKPVYPVRFWAGKFKLPLVLFACLAKQRAQGVIYDQLFDWDLGSKTALVEGLKSSFNLRISFEHLTTGLDQSLEDACML